MIENVIVSQLESYLFTQNLYPLMQSGYRKFHSTESTLIKLFNDIGCALLDQGNNAVLIFIFSYSRLKLCTFYSKRFETFV